MSGEHPAHSEQATALRGRPPRWGALGLLALLGCLGLGLWLRLRGLAVEGFADDEIHKWLAATRYLHGDFGGDDVEHPMLMKSLITLGAALLRGRLAPEALTRLPNALAGGISVWAVAELGRRLFGRAAGLIAAAVAATSATFIGYQRVGKEDTLLGLFLLLLLWCLAEAKAASTDGREGDQRRFEVAGAAFFGAMLASKYYLTYFLIPLLAWAFVAGRDGGVWRIPRRRWLWLVGVSLAVFAALNWTPFFPSTYDYFFRHLRGAGADDRAVSESLWFMGRLWGNLILHYRNALPVWFYPVFFAVKLAPLTLACAAFGLVLAGVRRGTSERIVLVWLGVWFVTFTLTGAKYGRVTISALPALFLLVGYAASEGAKWIGAVASGRASAAGAGGARAAAVAAVLGVLLAAGEGRAALSHAPHYRLYINAIGGGDDRVGYFFPHCDYFDAGLREAVGWIASRAEAGAEICSETEWPVRYYADRAGRTDLAVSTITRAYGCRTGHPCYVIAEAGRLYWHNEAALERLSRASPVHVESIRGVPVVRVYRLAPGEPLFPESPAAE